MFVPVKLGVDSVGIIELDISDFERSEPEESANGVGRMVEAQPSQDQGVAVGRSI